MKILTTIILVLATSLVPLLAQDHYESMFSGGSTSSSKWYRLAKFELSAGSFNSVQASVLYHYVNTNTSYEGKAQIRLRSYSTGFNESWQYQSEGTTLEIMKFVEGQPGQYELWGFSNSSYAFLSVEMVITKEKALTITTYSSPEDVTTTTGYTEYVPGGTWGLKDVVINNGKVGIGTSSPERKMHVYDGPSTGTSHSYAELVVEDDDHGMISILTPNDKQSYYGFADSEDDFVGGMQYSHSSDALTLRTNNHIADLRIDSNGNVGIGTTTPSSKLEVDGTITSEEVKVEVVGAPDYVFAPNYQLRSLKETEDYIKANSHLPEIPSAKEMEANGVELGEMNMLLLKKIEELTLYILDIEKRVKEIEK